MVCRLPLFKERNVYAICTWNAIRKAMDHHLNSIPFTLTKNTLKNRKKLLPKFTGCNARPRRS